jgi:hypothetical protein
MIVWDYDSPGGKSASSDKTISGLEDLNDDRYTYSGVNGSYVWSRTISDADHERYHNKCGSFYIDAAKTIEHGEGDGAAGGNLVDNGDGTYNQHYPSSDFGGIMYADDTQDGINHSALHIVHPGIPGLGADPNYETSVLLLNRNTTKASAGDWIKVSELGATHDYAPEPQAAMPPLHFFYRDGVSQESGIPLHLKFVDDQNNVTTYDDKQFPNDEECDDIAEDGDEVDDPDPFESFSEGVIASIGNSHGGYSDISTSSWNGYEGVDVEVLTTTADWRAPVRSQGEVISYQGNALVTLDCAPMNYHDTTAPQLCSAWTYDWDADGQIDRVILQFTETMDAQGIDPANFTLTETNNVASVFEDTDWESYTYTVVGAIDPYSDNGSVDRYYWGLEGDSDADDVDANGYSVDAKGIVTPDGDRDIPMGLVDDRGDRFVVLNIAEVSNDGYNGGDTDVTPDIELAEGAFMDGGMNLSTGPDANTGDFNGEEMFDCAAPAIMGILNANDDVVENDVEGRTKIIGPSTIEVRFSEPVVWSTLIQGRVDPMEDIFPFKDPDRNAYDETEDEDAANTNPNSRNDGYRIVDIAFDQGTLDTKTDVQSNDIADLHALVSGKHVGTAGCVGGELDDPDELVVVDPAQYAGCLIHGVRVFFTANNLFNNNASPQVDVYFKDMGFVSDVKGIFNNQHGNAHGSEANFRRPTSNRNLDVPGQAGPDSNNENNDYAFGVWTQDWWGDPDDYLDIAMYGFAPGQFVERGVRATNAQGVAAIAGAADGCSSVIDVPETNGSILEASLCRSVNDPFSTDYVDGSTVVTEYQIFRKDLSTGAFTLVARMTPPSQNSAEDQFGVVFPLLPVSSTEYAYYAVAIGGGTSSKDDAGKAEFDAVDAVTRGEITLGGKDLGLTNKVGQTYASEAVFVGSVSATDPFPPEDLTDPKIYDGNVGNTLVGTFPTPSEHGQVDLYQFPGLLSLPSGIVMIPKISAYRVYRENGDEDILVATIPATGVQTQNGRVRLTFSPDAAVKAGEEHTYYMTAIDGINESGATEPFNATVYGGSGIVGDGDADGCIDVMDLTLMGNVYNSTLGDINYTTAYDFNADSRINLIDFTLFGDSFGQGCGAGKLAASDKALDPSGAQLAVDFDGQFVTVYAAGLEAEGVQFTFTAEGAEFVNVQQGSAFANGLAVQKQGEAGEVTFAVASLNGKISDGVIAVFELNDRATEVNLSNIAVVRMSETGKPVKMSAEAVKAIGIPDAFALEQNYPNPFNPTTNIRFSLPETNDVTLEVYDLTGRLVRTLVSGQVEAGVHTMTWDGKDASGVQVASGVYLYRIQAGAFNQTNKMTLLK